MKKQIVCLVLCSLLSACIRAGDYDLAPVRKKIVNSMNGYGIDYQEQREEHIRRQGEREHDYVKNKAITVKKGEAVLSDKFFDRDTYRTFVYKVNKKGALHNQAYSMRLDNRAEYNILGWVTIDGERYSLIESELDDYVFLFDDSGKFYNKAGYIKDGVLMILDEEVFAYPSDLRIKKIAKTRDEVSNIKDGYEIKYGGIKLDRIWFDYMAYDQVNNNGGVFEKINFPNKPGLIMINGKGLRILDANKDALTYMILKD